MVSSYKLTTSRTGREECHEVTNRSSLARWFGLHAAYDGETSFFERFGPKADGLEIFWSRSVKLTALHNRKGYQQLPCFAMLAPLRVTHPLIPVKFILYFYKVNLF